MYHISLYFDEKTTVHMHKLIEKVARATGNKYMLEAKVPPHITLCALECTDEELLKERLKMVQGVLKQGSLQWVSIGTFLPGVIFLQPVLNEYLQGLMEQVYACVQGFHEQKRESVQVLHEIVREHAEKQSESAYADERNGHEVKVKSCYKPFSWLPHSTVAKKLTSVELQTAFEVLQKEFKVFEGQVVRMGLAKMNPHQEIVSWELQ